jgi:Raf kinase inhibitor-like YbhB/YbcL family protein
MSEGRSSGAFKLNVVGIPENGTIPEKFIFNDWGCTGENKSPGLNWSSVPEGTKSFAITLYDPDAPTGSGFWHWVIFNIPASAISLPEDVANNGGVPAPSIEGRTDWGAPGYGGPVPPPGDDPHRYAFTIHALGVEELPLDNQASAAMVGFMIHQNRIGSADFTAFYGR